MFTHITARVPGPKHHFLINPYGMMFEEITASSLVKINLRSETQARLVSAGLGPEKLLWPGLLRRLDRLDASYRD